MKVEKWGDDLAIRLPAEIVEFLDLEEGDEVDIRVSGPDTFDIERTRGIGRMLVRLHKAAPQRERRV
jgi:antitoxin MazE